jgi:hypothetical protein
MHLVVLNPDADAVAERDRGRPKTAYADGRWDIGELRELLRFETERVGLWLDSTDLSAEQTVDQILGDLNGSLVQLAWPLSKAGQAGQPRRSGPPR